MNLAENLVRTAADRGDQIAVKLDDVALNYAVLDQATQRVACLLRERGLQVGDGVGLMLPNVTYFPVLYYGILRAGGVVVPMNVLLKGREVAYYLDDSGAKMLFAWHGFAEAAEAGAEKAGAELTLVEPGKIEEVVFAADPVEEVAERAGDDTAVLLYTSGTTGTPKGAELTHDNLLSNVEASRKLIDVGPDAVILGALPLFHSFGQTCGMNAAVRAGATLTLIPRFDPVKALEIVQRDKVTIFEGVPTMYVALLSCDQRSEFDTSTLETCVSGGAAMPGEVLRGFEEAFGCEILEEIGRASCRERV